MARRKRMMTIATPFKHPLVLAVLLYLPLAISGFGLDLRLFMLEPMAWASGTAEAPNHEELSDDERKALQLASLQDQVAELAWENELLRQGYVQLSAIKAELPELSDDAILARILVRGDSSNWRHTIYINLGTEDGVSVGNPVTIGHTLIGKVREAGLNISAVQLITDADCVVPVTIVPGAPTMPEERTATAFTKHIDPDNDWRDNIFTDVLQLNRGLMRGEASAKPRVPNLPISDVNLESRVAEGDLVVTNDAQGHFPSGLLVGKVSQVHNRNTFLDLVVESAMDLTITDVVTVIRHRRPTLDENMRMTMEKRHLDKIEEDK